MHFQEGRVCFLDKRRAFSSFITELCIFKKKNIIYEEEEYIYIIYEEEEYNICISIPNYAFFITVLCIFKKAACAS